MQVPEAKLIPEPDVEIIRGKIASCTEMAHSIRGKALQLNDREARKEKEMKKEKDTQVEPANVGEELKNRLASLHELLCDSFNSLSAFV